MTKKISGFSIEQLREMPPDLLRAVIREKAHFTVEYPIYQARYANKRVPPNLGQALSTLLNIWEERGLPSDGGDDLRWCYTLLDLVKLAVDGKLPQDFGEPVESFSEPEKQTVARLLRTRRSIRFWQDRPVPGELVEEVLTAGLWAPHSCNLQSIRYIVMVGDEGRDVFGPRKIAMLNYPVRVVVSQDMRVYQDIAGDSPVYNQDLDCGAAVQNMLLRAHSLGLGAVWTTFLRDESEILHRRFGLPAYIRLRTCVTLGWPAQRTVTPGRISLEDAVLAWVE